MTRHARRPLIAVFMITLLVDPVVAEKDVVAVRRFGTMVGRDKIAERSHPALYRPSPHALG
jgi:hypothetical protein